MVSYFVCVYILETHYNIQNDPKVKSHFCEYKAHICTLEIGQCDYQHWLHNYPQDKKILSLPSKILYVKLGKTNVI